MDRLRHLIVAGLLLAGCSKEPGSVKPQPAELPRTVGVEAEADPAALKTFCDKSWATDAPAFGGGPRLKEGTASAGGGWRWVNFWATWCAPCLEEMPMLGRWRDGLVKEGANFTLELWSVDEDEGKLRQRVQAGLPGTVKWVAGPESLAEYLGKIGLDPESMLPIHMLVDPKDRLRCVRIGAVSENDYGTVRKLIGR
jgi:thiol-disulfide isomerase/thioredoxin